MSYVEDNLVKYHCFECDRAFILSDYWAKDADVMCPYCHGKDVQPYVFMEEECELDLGCMGMGHHDDPVEARLCYERTWAKVKEMRQKNID